MEYKKSEASDSGEFLNKMELDEEQWQSIGHTWDGSNEGKVFLGPLPDSVMSNKEYETYIKKMDEYFKNGGSFTQEPVEIHIDNLDEFTKQYDAVNKLSDPTSLHAWMEKYDAVNKWKPFTGAAKSGPSVMSPINQLKKANAEGFEKEVLCPANYSRPAVWGQDNEETWDPCPSVGTLWNMVQHLNDLHEWTRERIADWVEESGLNFEFQIPEEDQ